MTAATKTKTEKGYTPKVVFEADEYRVIRVAKDDLVVEVVKKQDALGQKVWLKGNQAEQIKYLKAFIFATK